MQYESRVLVNNWVDIGRLLEFWAPHRSGDHSAIPDYSHLIHYFAFIFNGNSGGNASGCVTCFVDRTTTSLSLPNPIFGQLKPVERKQKFTKRRLSGLSTNIVLYQRRFQYRSICLRTKMIHVKWLKLYLTKVSSIWTKYVRLLGLTFFWCQRDILAWV